jgi:four helix bundle protein
MSIDRHKELKERAKAFALRVFRMSQALPKTREANVIMQQLLRSFTSMASNYRAAGRTRSKAEFISKLGVVVEEADETVFWLEFLADTGIVSATKLRDLLNEANQLLLIFSASRSTAKT